MNMNRLILMSLCVLFFTGTALAHWEPGDGHKMHFPQLPDPCGWDVLVTEPIILADDWQCSESGPIRDIHFWGSWKNDEEGTISGIHVGIYPDDRTGLYSKPGETPFYERLFLPHEFTVALWGKGEQGWFDPNAGEFSPGDHNNIYQVNIADINDPYWQEEGEIYWLAITADVEGGLFGWKTSHDHFEDDAVYDVVIQEQFGWNELRDPIENEISLDMAFVITPEPATVALLGIGAVLMALARRRT